MHVLQSHMGNERLERRMETEARNVERTVPWTFLFTHSEAGFETGSQADTNQKTVMKVRNTILLSRT